MDKDGTLIEDVPYNVEPSKIRLTRGASSALPFLQRHGFRIFVVSNQPGVALGKFKEEQLEDVRLEIEKRLEALGVRLSGFYFCPHAAGEGCDCRKPAAGMILKAAETHGIDLSRSWMIGDILDDMEAGRRAGCSTVMVHQGHETEWKLGPGRWPDYVVSDLMEAAWTIGLAGKEWDYARSA